MLCIKNGTVHDGVHREGFQADILVEDGKIKAIGENLEIPGDAEVVDADGLQVYPGFVEAHGHIGLDGYGIGYEGMDYNEMNDILSPQMRGIDGVKPMDPAFPKAAAAGVTCVCVGPGSANVLGGTFTTIKTVGKRVDDMVVRDGVAMKCAFGENPKRVYRDKKDSSRMTTAALLRETLFKAGEYMEKKEAAGDDISKRPAFDMKLEALLPVMRKEIPLKAHAHAAEDLFTALRIAREFDLKITLEHVTEGHLIVEELVKENVPLAVGPTLGSASKFELRNKSWITPGVLAAAASGRGGLPGVHHHGFPGDSPGIPAPVRRPGGTGRDGSLCRASGHHHQSRKACGHRGPGGIAGSRERRGYSHHGRLSL